MWHNERVNGTIIEERNVFIRNLERNFAQFIKTGDSLPILEKYLDLKNQNRSFFCAELSFADLEKLIEIAENIAKCQKRA